MKYSIAKLPIKSIKSNARRSHDTRRICDNVNNIETGCTKINQMIQCMNDIVSNYTNRVEIIYDAPTDILDLTVKLNGNIQYKFEFHLIVDDDKLGYNIKVDKIDWAGASYPSRRRICKRRTSVQTVIRDISLELSAQWQQSGPIVRYAHCGLRAVLLSAGC